MTTEPVKQETCSHRVVKLTGSGAGVIVNCDRCGVRFLPPADHDAAREQDSLRNRYWNLVEEMTKILRAVRHSEGEQLSHQEIAARAVGLAQERDAYREALRRIAVAGGPTHLGGEVGMMRSLAREALDYPAAKAEGE